MTTRTPVLFLSPLLATALCAQAIRVPAEQPTIAAAFAAATTGTTILVAPGTYVENLVWPATDGIRLIAERGPNVTTLDGNGAGRVIYMFGTYTNATRVEGFTIRGGALSETTSYGAGLHLRSSSSGGCSPSIVGNVIRDNVCAGSVRSYGAGLYVFGSSTATSSPLIAGNRFIDNDAVSGAYAHGGGMYALDAAPRVIGNVFRGNLAHDATYSFGGGLYLWNADDAVVASNVFDDNEARDGIVVFGGGLHLGSSDNVSLANNTFLDNTAATGASIRGGGIQLYDVTNSSTQNNIFTGNVPEGVEVFGGSGLTFDYNVYWGGGGTIVGGSMGPNSQVTNPQISATTYKLSASSPCVEAGSATAVPSLVDVDFEGSPRNLDSDFDAVIDVDIGADELGKAKLALQWGLPQIGTVFNMNVTGYFGTHSWLLFLDAGTGNTIIDPIGNWLLSPFATYWDSGTMPGVSNVAIPNLTFLRGITLHFQAIVASGSVGEATNRLDLTIH